jgi:hypothetical protein
MDPSLLSRFFDFFLNIWAKPLLRITVEGGLPSVEFHVANDRRETIDERIHRIDVARQNLSEALDAMDELKHAAEWSKAELVIALERLDSAQRDRAAAEKELEAVRGIAQSDVEVFKKLAGVPSRLEIAKERLIGFLLGITASIIASGIWWGLSKIWPLLKT